MKSICLASFSPLVCDAQCCEVKIHFAITYGERPLPMKKSKTLKVSFSAVGFFQEGCCTCILVGWIWNEKKTSLLSKWKSCRRSLLIYCLVNCHVHLRALKNCKVGM